MNDYILRGIPPQAVDKFWHFAEPYVKRALDHTFGELSHENLKAMCENRDAQLWMMAKEGNLVGAGITQIVTYPSMKTCRIITMAGSDFKNWMGLAHITIELWAKNLGCSAIEAYCRKGFIPQMQEIGFKHRYSVAHKPI